MEYIGGGNLTEDKPLLKKLSSLGIQAAVRHLRDASVFVSPMVLLDSPLAAGVQPASVGEHSLCYES